MLDRPKRLSPDQSRAAAVGAARELLREQGVAAVTLKAVAARIGRTHANLLHHFGSVAELHRALAADIAAGICASITDTIQHVRRGEATARDVVDTMFDAFSEQGAGELIGWIALTRQRDALEPVVDTVNAIIADFREAHDDRPMDRVTLGLVLLAIGDSLVGKEMTAATGQPRDAVRDIATQQIRAIVESRR